MKAPLRDPIVYQIIGYKVSLRREEASMIEVLSESEAEQHIKSPQTEDQHPLESHEPQVGMPAADSSEQLQELMKRLAEERGHHIRVALVGNPNCGKTSLFNIASGSHEHVGNYSGVTVDAKEGHFDYAGYHFTIVDLPGTYSLSAYSPEELYVRKNLIENTPDIIINVVDGANLERNLYLTMQLIDMNLPMVIALNMYDELLKSGDKFDYPSLASMLGTPIVPTVCRNSKGIGDLFDTVISTCLGQNAIARRHIHVNHGDTLEQSINRVRAAIADGAEDLSSRYSLRFLAIKLLENDSDIRRVIETKPNAAKVSSVVSEEEKRIEDELQESSESAIVDAKYGFISGALKETYHAHQRSQTKRTLTERIDAVVTNKYWGYPVFFLILFLMFEATFKIGQYPMDWIDDLVGWIGQLVGQYMPAGILKGSAQTPRRALQRFRTVVEKNRLKLNPGHVPSSPSPSVRPMVRPRNSISTGMQASPLFSRVTQSTVSYSRSPSAGTGSMARISPLRISRQVLFSSMKTIASASPSPGSPVSSRICRYMQCT